MLSQFGIDIFFNVKYKIIDGSNPDIKSNNLFSHSILHINVVCSVKNFVKVYGLDNLLLNKMTSKIDVTKSKNTSKVIVPMNIISMIHSNILKFNFFIIALYHMISPKKRTYLLKVDNIIGVHLYQDKHTSCRHTNFFQ